ncbi:hypothetical protein RE428_06930 [Marinobacter nanhaiticus D15-8W]|uniref:Fibronectin type III domain-containing protein n=1 Tax=Marinobacter nanhaiticus D15-8W TaxID=626887 RepID=N6X0R2_9GAMM|nr:fibronectin type III domain-containing protein [Marinobacter nanhaiticus]ENO14638.1 fibronectin type III domain-containing protein [Marinobacter nanhaiticus D15-8W]BES69675.1 hypothetical protein RE428_06930 [Marinobacter nanhaiticus D15-8W]
MRSNQSFNMRLPLAYLLLATFALAGCKTGGSSTGASTNAYYDAESDSLVDAGLQPSVVHLQWLAPATRADGSKLYAGEIGGYRIYYKLRHQDAFRIIDIDDAGNTSYPLEGFSPGVYEFSVSTLDVEGLESQRSKAVSVNII